jgi:hypothetical protein
MEGNVVRPGHDVETAIACVLDAEHAARAAVDEAGATAIAINEAARAAARSLAERTERRIRRVRGVFEQRTATSVAALEAAAAEAAAPHALTADDLSRLDAAVAALAARLTRGGV